MATTGQSGKGRPAVAASGGQRPPGSATAERDRRCIAEVLAGERGRFEELVTRYQALVFRVALACTRDAHEAEDVAQEVFVTAFVSLGQLRAGERFLPWLLQIARHKASRAGHRQGARPDKPAGSAPESIAPEPDDSAERITAALALVEELPEPVRKTVQLKYEQGLSCRQIAEQEKVAIGTITSRLARALAMLRTAVK